MIVKKTGIKSKVRARKKEEVIITGENTFNKRYLLILFIFFLAVFGIFINFKLNSYQKVLKEKPVNKMQVANIKKVSTPSPTASVAPTITLTPTVASAEAVIVNKGFCLSIPILMYHHVEPLDQAKAEGHASLTVDSNTFDSQMKYLTDHGYQTLSADELANALISHQGLGKAALVTIDDGYSDIYSYAFPIAKKYNIKLNLMIPTGLVENPGYMTWGNLKEMTGSGMVFAYDHTWSHYSLPRGDATKEEMEILTAKKQLEDNLGKTVKIFAYPYGSSNQQSINILVKNGFVAAFSTIPGTYQCEGYIFNLRRTRIGNAPLSYYGL